MTPATTPQLPAFIRTYVPLGVAALVGWLANLGILLPTSASEGLALFLGTLAGALWYAGVRYLEKKWPALGVLLGSTKTPVYMPPGEAAMPVLSDGQLAALRAVRDTLDEGEARDAIETVLPARHLNTTQI